MKYLITENQLKTLRKYMKSFINEGYDDNIPSGTANDPNAPWNKDYDSDGDEVSILDIVDNNGKLLVRAKYDSEMDEIYTEENTKDINIINSIENRLEELKDNGALDIILDNDRITYQELMDRSQES
jgi:hypothetical protein